MIDIKYTVSEIVRIMADEELSCVGLTDDQKTALKYVAEIVIRHQVEKAAEVEVEKEELQYWEIWAEGYTATGTDGKKIPHTYKGRAIGYTFEDACNWLFQDDEYFDAKKMTYWGCALYGKVCDEPN